MLRKSFIKKLTALILICCFAFSQTIQAAGYSDFNLSVMKLANTGKAETALSVPESLTHESHIGKRSELRSNVSSLVGSDIKTAIETSFVPHDSMVGVVAELAADLTPERAMGSGVMNGLEMHPSSYVAARTKLFLRQGEGRNVLLERIGNDRAVDLARQYYNQLSEMTGSVQVGEDVHFRKATPFVGENLGIGSLANQTQQIDVSTLAVELSSGFENSKVEGSASIAVYGEKGTIRSLPWGVYWNEFIVGPDFDSQIDDQFKNTLDIGKRLKLLAETKKKKISDLNIAILHRPRMREAMLGMIAAKVDLDGYERRIDPQNEKEVTRFLNFVNKRIQQHGFVKIGKVVFLKDGDVTPIWMLKTGELDALISSVNSTTLSVSAAWTRVIGGKLFARLSVTHVDPMNRSSVEARIKRFNISHDSVLTEQDLITSDRFVIVASAMKLLPFFRSGKGVFKDGVPGVVTDSEGNVTVHAIRMQGETKSVSIWKLTYQTKVAEIINQIKEKVPDFPNISIEAMQQLNAQDAELFFRLGEVYGKYGDLERAKHWVRTAETISQLTGLEADADMYRSVWEIFEGLRLMVAGEMTTPDEKHGSILAAITHMERAYRELKNTKISLRKPLGRLITIYYEYLGDSIMVKANLENETQAKHSRYEQAAFLYKKALHFDHANIGLLLKMRRAELQTAVNAYWRWVGDSEDQLSELEKWAKLVDLYQEFALYRLKGAVWTNLCFETIYKYKTSLEHVGYMSAFRELRTMLETWNASQLTREIPALSPALAERIVRFRARYQKRGSFKDLGHLFIPSVEVESGVFSKMVEMALSLITVQKRGLPGDNQTDQSRPPIEVLDKQITWMEVMFETYSTDWNAQQIGSQLAETYYWKALVLSNLGRPKESQEFFRKTANTFKEIQKRYGGIFAFSVQMRLIEVAITAGHLDEAKSELERFKDESERKKLFFTSHHLPSSEAADLTFFEAGFSSDTDLFNQRIARAEKFLSKNGDSHRSELRTVDFIQIDVVWGVLEALKGAIKEGNIPRIAQRRLLLQEMLDDKVLGGHPIEEEVRAVLRSFENLSPAVPASPPTAAQAPPSPPSERTIETSEMISNPPPKLKLPSSLAPSTEGDSLEDRMQQLALTALQKTTQSFQVTADTQNPSDWLRKHRLIFSIAPHGELILKRVALYNVLSDDLLMMRDETSMMIRTYFNSLGHVIIGQHVVSGLVEHAGMPVYVYYQRGADGKGVPVRLMVMREEINHSKLDEISIREHAVESIPLSVVYKQTSAPDSHWVPYTSFWHAPPEGILQHRGLLKIMTDLDKNHSLYLDGQFVYRFDKNKIPASETGKHWIEAVFDNGFIQPAVKFIDPLTRETIAPYSLQFDIAVLRINRNTQLEIEKRYQDQLYETQLRRLHQRIIQRKLDSSGALWLAGESVLAGRNNPEFANKPAHILVENGYPTAVFIFQDEQYQKLLKVIRLTSVFDGQTDEFLGVFEHPDFFSVTTIKKYLQSQGAKRQIRLRGFYESAKPFIMLGQKVDLGVPNFFGGNAYEALISEEGKILELKPDNPDPSFFDHYIETLPQSTRDEASQIYAERLAQPFVAKAESFIAKAGLDEAGEVINRLREIPNQEAIARKLQQDLDAMRDKLESGEIILESNAIEVFPRNYARGLSSDFLDELRDLDFGEALAKIREYRGFKMGEFAELVGAPKGHYDLEARREYVSEGHYERPEILNRLFKIAMVLEIDPVILLERKFLEEVLSEKLPVERLNLLFVRYGITSAEFVEKVSAGSGQKIQITVSDVKKWRKGAVPSLAQQAVVAAFFDLDLSQIFDAKFVKKARKGHNELSAGSRARPAPPKVEAKQPETRPAPPKVEANQPETRPAPPKVEANQPETRPAPVSSFQSFNNRLVAVLNFFRIKKDLPDETIVTISDVINAQPDILDILESAITDIEAQNFEVEREFYLKKRIRSLSDRLGESHLIVEFLNEIWARDKLYVKMAGLSSRIRSLIKNIENIEILRRNEAEFRHLLEELIDLEIQLEIDPTSRKSATFGKDFDDQKKKIEQHRASMDSFLEGLNVPKPMGNAPTGRGVVLKRRSELRENIDLYSIFEFDKIAHLPAETGILIMNNLATELGPALPVLMRALANDGYLVVAVSGDSFTRSSFASKKEQVVSTYEHAEHLLRNAKTPISHIRAFGLLNTLDKDYGAHLLKRKIIDSQSHVSSVGELADVLGVSIKLVKEFKKARELLINV